VARGFHPLSHHGGNEERVEEFGVLNRYHVGVVPYLLETLRASLEGDTNLLDTTMVMYGSPMGDPNLHNHKRCPLFVVGGEKIGLGGNLHVRADDETPMANVLLSLMHQLGLDDMESFGDSTGAFPLSV